MKTHHKIREQGQSLILIVFGIVGLIAVAGLAIDGGAAMANRRNAQNAADNAAMAAALAITQGNDPYTAAYQVAAANGYDNNGTDNTVTINISTDYADINGDAVARDAAYFQNNNEFYIKVTIDSKSATSIAKVVGKDEIEAHASAVSHAIRGGRQPLYGGNALVALSQHDADAFGIMGGVLIDIENSGMFINSDNSQAMTVGGGTIINTDNGIGIVGGASFNNSVTIDGYTIAWNAKNPPTVRFGVPQQPVPPDYSFIPEPPAPPSCDGLPTITKNEWNNWPDGEHIVLQPGNYVNGITMLGGVTQLTMESGVYCIHDHFQLNGGMNVIGGDVKLVPQSNFDFQINGGITLNFDNLEYYPEDGDLIINGGNTLNADRFRFYATGDASFDMLGGAIFNSSDTFFYVPEGTVTWLGGAIIDMHAPPADDPDGYGGLLIYKPWDNTEPETFYGGSAINLVGSIIMPHTDLQFMGGTMANAIDTQIVTYTTRIMGGAIMHIQFNDANQYQAPIPPLVELLE